MHDDDRSFKPPKRQTEKKLWKTYQLSSFIDLRFGQNDSTQRQPPFHSQKEMVSCRFGGEITLIWSQIPTWHPSTRHFWNEPSTLLTPSDLSELNDDRRAVQKNRKKGSGLRLGGYDMKKTNGFLKFGCIIWVVPLPVIDVIVTTRIITFLVGNPYKPSFPLLCVPIWCLRLIPS